MFGVEDLDYSPTNLELEATDCSMSLSESERYNYAFVQLRNTRLNKFLKRLKKSYNEHISC